MLSIFKRKPAFEQGYDEATALVNEASHLREREILEHLGILPPEIISDMYDIWNPAADRTTEMRFGGDDAKFYEFQDGAELALQESNAGRATV